MTIIGPKTLVGGIFALLASAFIVAGLWQTYEANRIAVLGEPAIGTVESVNRIFTGGQRGGYTFIPVVRFGPLLFGLFAAPFLLLGGWLIRAEQKEYAHLME